MNDGPLFIAEVKTRSPFGFRSQQGWGDLLELALEYGDMVAVHTNEQWGGSFPRLRSAAREIAGQPIDLKRPLLLAKGIHETDNEIRHALNCGADLVLVVGRRPPRELAPVCIWEPSRAHDLVHLNDPRQKVMWNLRDLETGGRVPLDVRWARKVHAGWLSQASFIRRPADVHPEVDAFIVGEHLAEYIEATDGDR